MPQASKRSHSCSARLVLHGSIGSLPRLPRLFSLHRIARIARIQRTGTRPHVLSLPLHLRLRILSKHSTPRLAFFLLFASAPLLRFSSFLLRTPHSTHHASPLPTNAPNSTASASLPLRSPPPRLFLIATPRIHPPPIDLRGNSAARDAADRVADAPNCRCSASGEPRDCAPAIRPSNHTRRRWGFAWITR